MTRFAELLRQNQEHSIFRSQSLKGKMKEAINDLKTLFKNLNVIIWKKIEEVSLIYPPEQALRIIWTSKDFGIREAINAALFLDDLYACTKLVISILKEFNIANVSTKVFHNERNINSCFKFIFLLSSSIKNDENSDFEGSISGHRSSPFSRNKFYSNQRNSVINQTREEAFNDLLAVYSTEIVHMSF